MTLDRTAVIFFNFWKLQDTSGIAHHAPTRPVRRLQQSIMLPPHPPDPSIRDPSLYMRKALVVHLRTWILDAGSMILLNHVVVLGNPKRHPNTP